MNVPVLTAVSDPGREARLVAAFDRGAQGVTVVRRCVDVADLLAAAAAGTARAVVLSADLRRLDAEVLSRLFAARVAVVALVSSGDLESERRLCELGVRHVLPAGADAETVARALLDAASSPVVGPVDLSDPRLALPDLVPVDPQPSSVRGSGRIVAVWGPAGAPGRTTVSIGLADESARLGVSTLLVDADNYGGVIAQALGILDESPGLAAASRLAGHGRLDPAELAGLARGLGARLRVLTGLTRADRWPELRPAAIRTVLDIARSLVELTVVDCGFCIEEDEELSFDTTAPRRNGSTLAVLEAADVVLVVGAADPIGTHRLIRGLAELRDRLPDLAPRVVVNKVRASVLPGDPRREVAVALRRFASVEVSQILPWDGPALDRALAVGRTLGESTPGSSLRHSLVTLAEELTG